jgi:uncharacterized RDD family membrane protein YckC
MREQDQLDALAHVSVNLPERARRVGERLGLLDRLMLGIADVLLLFVLVALGGIVVWAVWKTRLMPAADDGLLILALMWVLSGLELRGASLAKWMAEVQIAAVDGSPAPRRALLVRWVIKNVPLAFLTGVILSQETRWLVDVRLRGWTDTFRMAMWISLAVVLLGFAMSAGRRRRALHDYAAGTCVMLRRDMRCDPDTASAFPVTVRQEMKG